MTMTEDRVASASAKAATLIEALPWLNRFHGQTVVIKYGGHAMAEAAPILPSVTVMWSTPNSRTRTRWSGRWSG